MGLLQSIFRENIMVVVDDRVQYYNVHDDIELYITDKHQEYYVVYAVFKDSVKCMLFIGLTTTYCDRMIQELKNGEIR